jgi:hypothetical protein
MQMYRKVWSHFKKDADFVSLWLRAAAVLRLWRVTLSSPGFRLVVTDVQRLAVVSRQMRMKQEQERRRPDDSMITIRLNRLL